MTIVSMVALGLLAGSLSAALGIGGGIIYVPVLAIIAGLDQHVAQGTSLAIVLPAAIVGTVVNARADRVVWGTAVPAIAGSLAGGFLGARVALYLDAAVLRKLFAALLVLVAVRTMGHRESRRSSASDRHVDETGP